MSTGSPNSGSAEASIRESVEQPAATSPPPPEASRSETAADQNPSIHPWRNVWVAAISLIILGVLATLGIMATLPRLANDRALNAAAAQVSTARPRVTVAQAHKGAPTSDRVLPGNALPLDDAMIFARTTGYLDQRLVDIGDRVKAGQLLAVISAPQVDDQLRQNEANLVQAKANLDFAKASWDLAKAILARESKAAQGARLLRNSSIKTEPASKRPQHKSRSRGHRSKSTQRSSSNSPTCRNSKKSWRRSRASLRRGTSTWGT